MSVWFDLDIIELVLLLLVVDGDGALETSLGQVSQALPSILVDRSLSSRVSRLVDSVGSNRILKPKSPSRIFERSSHVVEAVCDT